MSGKACPACGRRFEADYEEVDIGVGVQKFLIGVTCDGCGKQYAACYTCGALDFEDHPEWCDRKDAQEREP